MRKHAEEWINKAMVRVTPKGAMADIRMYVFPDTHGNLQHIDPKRDGKKGVQQENCPVSDVDDAMMVLRGLWERLTREHEPKK